MGIDLGLSSLMEYTDLERAKWHEWMRKRGSAVLKISAGLNGDGRFTRAGLTSVAPMALGNVPPTVE